MYTKFVLPHISFDRSGPTHVGSCLKTGQHSIFLIIRKIIKKTNTSMLDTLFIHDL